MNPRRDADHVHMREALALASQGSGHASPNPMVGAVVVREGVVVGKGYHERVGGPHAEVNALRDAGERANGATIYVTLEPCNHFGRTPPCTQAILDAGIARVVVGMLDPNPGVEGGGARFLREKGLSVTTHVQEKECRLINQAFIKHITTGLPYVTLKAAATLDGRIATTTGDSRWISNELSRRYVHELRAALDGILVGIGTALNDDPQLTARLSDIDGIRQPVRIVVDSQLRIPLESKLVATAKSSPVWIACSCDIPGEKARMLQEAGVDILLLPGKAGRVNLKSLLQELGKRHMTSLLVEGGAHILGSFIENGLADAFHFFYAPKVLGDPRGIPMIIGGPRVKMSEAFKAYGITSRSFGDDVMISGRFHPDLY